MLNAMILQTNLLPVLLRFLSVAATSSNNHGKPHQTSPRVEQYQYYAKSLLGIHGLYSQNKNLDSASEDGCGDMYDGVSYFPPSNPLTQVRHSERDDYDYDYWYPSNNSSSDTGSESDSDIGDSVRTWWSDAVYASRSGR